MKPGLDGLGGGGADIVRGSPDAGGVWETGVMRELAGSTPDGFGTILADPPWRFSNRTGKMAPEHQRLRRYPTMTFEQIQLLPVASIARPESHLYLWVPNALLEEGLDVMKCWGFVYKTNIVWFKVRKDGGPDGRGVGFYFRNVTELCLFGTRGSLRTQAPGRRQVNMIASQKREHSRKPEELYDIIQACSPPPFVELFARHPRDGWSSWGNEIVPSPLCLPPMDSRWWETCQSFASPCTRCRANAETRPAVQHIQRDLFDRASLAEECDGNAITWRLRRHCGACGACDFETIADARTVHEWGTRLGGWQPHENPDR